MRDDLIKALRSSKRRFHPSTAIGELRRSSTLPTMKKPMSLQSLMKSEKTASVFFERLGEALDKFTELITKAASRGKPAYSNPFAGYQSRRGYGERGEHAPAHPDPFKWTTRPGAKDPRLSGLAEQARATRLHRENRRREQLQAGTKAFGRAALGGVRGGAPGAVIGGVLGAPLGPLGIAGGATAGGLLGGSIGAGMAGGGKMIGKQVMRDVGLPIGR
jgi:hypothetical protein